MRAAIRPEPDVLTTDEAAALLGVDNREFRRMRPQHRLDPAYTNYPPHGQNLYRRADVERVCAEIGGRVAPGARPRPVPRSSPAVPADAVLAWCARLERALDAARHLVRQVRALHDDAADRDRSA